MAVNAFIEEYSNAKGFTEYSIRVTLMRDSWFVHRRFTDFVNLDSDLRALGEDNLAPLPPKKFFNRMDPQFIRERAEKLQEYLDHMLRKSTIIERRPVMEFLELNQHPEALQDTRAARASTVARKEARLKEIVDEAAHTFIPLSPASQHPHEDMGPPSPKQRSKSSNAMSHVVNDLLHTLRQRHHCVPASRTAAVAEVLSRPPAIPVNQQEDLIHAIGGLLSDAYRDVSSIQVPPTAEPVVCHMSRD